MWIVDFLFRKAASSFKQLFWIFQRLYALSTFCFENLLRFMSNTHDQNLEKVPFRFVMFHYTFAIPYHVSIYGDSWGIHLTCSLKIECMDIAISFKRWGRLAPLFSWAFARTLFDQWMMKPVLSDWAGNASFHNVAFRRSWPGPGTIHKNFRRPAQAEQVWRGPVKQLWGIAMEYMAP